MPATMTAWQTDAGKAKTGQRHQDHAAAGLQGHGFIYSPQDCLSIVAEGTQ